ncbi:hypothetical protein L195_g019375, partial [Trifolium pratense]
MKEGNRARCKSAVQLLELLILLLIKISAFKQQRSLSLRRSLALLGFLVNNNASNSMAFTFTAERPPNSHMKTPPDPPDRGGKGGIHENDKHVKSTVSFRDKVLGNHATMEREK